MSNIETVLIYSSQIEKILKSKFRAEGDGLGQQIRSIENSIDPELVKNIKWISRIRNEAAHEPLSFQMPGDFVNTCNNVITTLEKGGAATKNHSPDKGFFNNSAQRQKHPTIFIVLSWIVSIFFGTLVGILSGTLLIVILQKLNILINDSSGNLLALAIVGVTIFIFIGRRQQKIVKRFNIVFANWWAFATVLGGMSSIAIPLLIVANSDYKLVAQNYIMTMPSVLRPGLFILMAEIMGLMIGVFQFCILRKETTKAKWWLIASGLQGILMYELWELFISIWGHGLADLAALLLVPSLASIVTGMALLYLGKYLRPQTPSQS
jgi:hypothetical protein